MVWGYRAAALGLWFADHLDIHQAYLEYDFGAAALRVGRQKFNLASGDEDTNDRCAVQAASFFFLQLSYTP